MSGFLLDTHTVIWASHKAGNLSRAAASAIADEKSALFVSAVSAWEIARKASLGKLDKQIAREFTNFMRQAGYIELPISMLHAATAGSFAAAHKDPFDRILAAQASLENLILLSNDRELDAFGVRRVW